MAVYKKVKKPAQEQVGKSEEQRTSQQNKALHLYCALVADALNSAGYDLTKTIKVFKKGIEIPWTKGSVKEILWREIQKSLYNKISTTQLKKNEEIDLIYEVLNRFLGERLHIESIPFPHNPNNPYE